MAGETPVLVYHYRANGAAVIKRNPDLITRQELADIKSKHPNLKESSKTIPKILTTSIDIYQRDINLTTSGETKPNEESNVAGVRIPLSRWLEAALKGHRIKELVVLSSDMTK